MHYKGFLLALATTLSAYSLNAQTIIRPATRPAINTGVHTDTIVVKKGISKDMVACAVPYKKETEDHGYKAIPLAGQKSYFGDMDDYVTNFVRQYLHAHDKTLSCVQGRSPQPFSIIDNVLQQNNMPKELKYMAVIESALDHNAVSPAGAVGPWQLMSSTARLMGLTVSKRKDDRRDWYKSTNAAAKYLTTLYSQLNDWLLVIAAYNSGPAPVLRAINRTGSHNFWDIKQYLPRETQGYVLSFIATASIFENLSKFISAGTVPSDFDFANPAAYNTIAVKAAANTPMFSTEEAKTMAIVDIKEPMSIDVMAQTLQVDKKLLNKWNPDYEVYLYSINMDPKNVGTYQMRIPKDKLNEFFQNKELMQKRSKQLFADGVM